MIYSRLGKTDLEVSKLGFGTLRLPYENSVKSRVDEKKAEEIIRTAYEYGVNYFDTAENYLNHQAETVLGKCLKPIRKNVVISTKICSVHLAKGVETHVQECCERLKTDYIDLFLIHAITDDNWDNYREVKTVEILDRLKKAGVIRHIGFSYHGSEDFYYQMLKEYDWEVSQIQLNYIDRDIQAGERGGMFAYGLGLGVSVMSPLKGGMLVNGLNGDMKRQLSVGNPDYTYAEWGLKWLYGKSYVDVVLSGISSTHDLKENVRIVNDNQKLSKNEEVVLSKVRESFFDSGQIPCTKCNYCSICSEKIKISMIFDTYNHYLYDGKKLHYVAYYVFLTKGKLKCLQCRACEKKCPQKIKISDELQRIHNLFMTQANMNFFKRL